MRRARRSRRRLHRVAQARVRCWRQGPLRLLVPHDRRPSQARPARRTRRDEFHLAEPGPLRQPQLHRRAGWRHRGCRLKSTVARRRGCGGVDRQLDRRARRASIALRARWARRRRDRHGARREHDPYCRRPSDPCKSWPRIPRRDSEERRLRHQRRGGARPSRAARRALRICDPPIPGRPRYHHRAISGALAVHHRLRGLVARARDAVSCGTPDCSRSCQAGYGRRGRADSRQRHSPSAIGGGVRRRLVCR